MKGKVHSIETFGTLDGPGTRFVVFLQGCPMRCLYCHNPDTWRGEGKETDSGEILREALKYRRYYQNGGVTFSGGEPLAQREFLLELCKLFCKEGFHVAVDTSGCTFSEESIDYFYDLLPYVQLFLLDLKHIDNDAHRALTGRGNGNILQFAKFLDDNAKPTWIRYVLVPDITDGEDALRGMAKFISELKHVQRIQVLPYHTLGVHKYRELGLRYPLEGVPTPSDEQVTRAEKILKGEI